GSARLGGVAGELPVDGKTVRAIARGLGDHLPKKLKRAVIGQDTRESSAWIADTVTSGLVEAGVEVESAGVVTTPGVTYLARSQRFAAGVVISASHNPWQDNGIKVFGADGYKLSDQTELEIEGEIFELLNSPPAAVPSKMGKPSLPGDSTLHAAYVDSLSHPIAGAEKLTAVVDCANGAASAVAPEVFEPCGLRAEFTHNSPNGRNINENCGALHPEIVAREVVARKAGLGICFDGDADRVLFADARGRVVNGDAVMLLLAQELKRRNQLRKAIVVATTMSNMGL